MKVKSDIQKLEDFFKSGLNTFSVQQMASSRPLVVSAAAGGKGHTDTSTPGGGGRFPSVKRWPTPPYWSLVNPD